MVAKAFRYAEGIFILLVVSDVDELTKSLDFGNMLSLKVSPLPNLLALIAIEWKDLV